MYKIAQHDFLREAKSAKRGKSQRHQLLSFFFFFSLQLLFKLSAKTEKIMIRTFFKNWVLLSERIISKWEYIPYTSGLSLIPLLVNLTGSLFFPTVTFTSLLHVLLLPLSLQALAFLIRSLALLQATTLLISLNQKGAYRDTYLKEKEKQTVNIVLKIIAIH